jgi:hypothetical protein
MVNLDPALEINLPQTTQGKRAPMCMDCAGMDLTDSALSLAVALDGNPAGGDTTGRKLQEV